MVALGEGEVQGTTKLRYCTMLYTVLCCTVQYCTVLYTVQYTALCCIILRSILCCAELYFTAFCCTVPCFAVPYYHICSVVFCSVVNCNSLCCTDTCTQYSRHPNLLHCIIKRNSDHFRRIAARGGELEEIDPMTTTTGVLKLFTKNEYVK
jgi:hypothetical protein